MRRSRLLALLLFAVLTPSVLGSPATAGDTLTRIKARNEVRCGVSDGIPGLSFKGPDGRWSGMDVDFCRALAAAVLGDTEKVTYISLTAAARFPSLKAGEVDVLARNTTWTLEREARLEVMFAGILFFDGQSVLVPSKSHVREVSQLNGATVCIVKGSTHERNLFDYFRARNWSYQPVLVESQEKAAEALFSGQCQAFTSERPQLMATRLRAPDGPEGYLLLPDQITTEPMGPVVRRGDDEWFTIVRWVLFELFRAEELGLTQANVKTRIETRTEPLVDRWLEVDEIISKAMAIPPGWVMRVLASVGNYAEMFERNLGKESALKLDRGLNRLWTDGGLMYSPPFR